MTKPAQIIVIDDEPIVGERLKPFLEKDGHVVEIFSDPKKALERLKKGRFDIVVTDIRMGEVNGIQIMERVVDNSPGSIVVIITGYATIELARESLAKGAFDFIAKPFKLKEIRKTIQRAVETLDQRGAHVAAEQTR
jgi:DNA-binding NtrC family response regulator